MLLFVDHTVLPMRAGCLAVACVAYLRQHASAFITPTAPPACRRAAAPSAAAVRPMRMVLDGAASAEMLQASGQALNALTHFHEVRECPRLLCNMREWIIDAHLSSHISCHHCIYLAAISFNHQQICNNTAQSLRSSHCCCLVLKFMCSPRFTDAPIGDHPGRCSGSNGRHHILQQVQLLCNAGTLSFVIPWAVECDQASCKDQVQGACLPYAWAGGSGGC